jgi:hypothetical protein
LLCCLPILMWDCRTTLVIRYSCGVILEQRLVTSQLEFEFAVLIFFVIAKV